MSLTSYGLSKALAAVAGRVPSTGGGRRAAGGRNTIQAPTSAGGLVSRGERVAVTDEADVAGIEELLAVVASHPQARATTIVALAR